MRKITADTLSIEKFQAYGTFSNILNPEGYCLGDFYPDKLRNPISGTTPQGFSPLLVYRPEKMIIDTVEYHNHTGEIFLPLDTDIVIHVAPQSPTPIPEKTEAFIIPKGTIVRLHVGIYHYCPFSIEKEKGHVLIVLPERTYVNDCVVFKYEETNHMEIVL